MKFNPADYPPDPDAAPVNPLPVSVVVLALAIFGIELVFQAGNAGFIGGPEATGWRLAALERWGFSDPILEWMIDNRVFRWELAVRLVSYPFVHATFTQAAFALVFILALGKMVGEAFSELAVLVVFFGATLAGALAYSLVWDTGVVLFGAMPAAYGFIGAYSYMLWTNLAGAGAGRLRAFSLIGFLMGLQLPWALLYGGRPDWVADLAGFAAGFSLSFVVAPGGWRNLLHRLRDRA